MMPVFFNALRRIVIQHNREKHDEYIAHFTPGIENQAQNEE
jgi:uncharacterized circularly permuted ATP-grasp superfamily protein